MWWRHQNHILRLAREEEANDTGVHPFSWTVRIASSLMEVNHKEEERGRKKQRGVSLGGYRLGLLCIAP